MNEIIYKDPVYFDKNCSLLYEGKFSSLIKKDAKYIISVFHLSH